MRAVQVKAPHPRYARPLPEGEVLSPQPRCARPLPEGEVRSQRAHQEGGFTLVELITAMTVATIVVAFMALFMTKPVDAYQSQTRRAELVDSADSVMRLVARDVRSALPNSVRVTINGSVVALEMLNALDAVRYRDTDTTTLPDQELDLSAPDGAFATLGQFDVANGFSSAAHYLSIYNVGVPGANAYSLTGVITPTGTTIGIDNSVAGQSAVTMNPAFQFAYGSPGNRVFLVSGPVTYLCNTATQTIDRYTGYSIAANQADRDTANELTTAGGSSARVANNVTDCNIMYSAGTAQRAGLVTFDLTIGRTSSLSSTVERVRLLYQVHVENVP
jgi:MSHA biogenesis protein MshO